MASSQFRDGKDMAHWTESDVIAWLEHTGHAAEVPYFNGHEVDGEVLPYLTAALLEEMGIASLETRENLVKDIQVEAAKHQHKERRRNTIKPSPTMTRNLVDVYTEGATIEENDALYSHANRHGFLDGSEEAEEDIIQDEAERVIEREKKWQKMMLGGKKKGLTLEKLEKLPEFRRRVFKGIPYSWRIQVWKLFTVGELDPTKINIYQDLLQKPTAEADVNQIDLDINRTLRNHVVYKQRYGKGQMRLFNILRAYANYNKEVGFCQGMATIAAFLLIHCDEETTFWIMDTLVTGERFKLQGLWIAGFPTLMESFFVHEKLFKYHLPKLHKHFKTQNIHPSSYATRWYMTLFLSFPFHTCLRIWDIFLLEGYEVIFFLAIAALEYFQSELQAREFEGIMEFLGQIPKHEIDDDKLIQLMVRVMRKTYSSMPGKTKAFDLIKAEYKKILAEGGSPFGDY